MKIFPAHGWTLLCFAGLLILGGCGVNTTSLEQWQEPPPQTDTYERLFVVSLAEDAQAQEWVERELAEALAERGVRALVASDYLKHDVRAPANEVEEALAAAVELTDAQAVLVSSLRYQDTKLETLGEAPAPVVKSHPYGAYYDSLSIYWLHQNQVLHPPAAGPNVTTEAVDRAEEWVASDEIELEQTYGVETVLFDAGTQEPLWVARSQTEQAEGPREAIANYAQTVVRALANDDLIPAEPLPE